VPEDKVLAKRPWGVVDPPLQVIISVAMLVISAVYLGVAEAARDAAVAAVAGTPRAEDPSIQRQIGSPTPKPASRSRPACCASCTP
jgi:hypothetical protein